MTTAGEPPPLPPGDDPFALLGLGEGATEKDIRKAYARRIKVYRPDRAPAEFQRIHRAFELLTAGRAFELTRQKPVQEPAEPPAETEQAGAVISAAFVEIQAAARRGDSAEVDRLIGGLLDREVPLERLFEDPDNHDVLLRSAAITWTRLGDHDRPGRWAIWNQAFDRAYGEEPARAVRLLDDSELRHAVADHPSIAIMVLDRFASLAWRCELRPLVELFETYRPYLPGDCVVEHRADGVHLHFEASAQLKGVELPPLLSKLPALIVHSTIGTHEAERDAAAALRDALAAAVPSALAELGAWAKANQDGAQPPLRELIVHALSGHRCRLDGMPERRFDALTRALHHAGTGMSAARKVAMFGLIAGLSVIQLPVSLSVPVVALLFFLGTESWRYDREIAPAVAKAILDVPVLSTVVERWVRINPKLRGRLGRFDVGIENDWGLYMFSLLVAYTAEVGGLDAKLDDAL